MIITGAGKAFSAGFDISPREKPRTPVQDWRDHAKDGNETGLRVWRSPLRCNIRKSAMCEII
jgi:enoyl-CoA hydratase/carnithine racemase